jgi:hypothetical protein
MMILKRLWRRVTWLFIYQWKTITLKKWPYESCKKCGKVFRTVWQVEDSYWNKVIGSSDGGGILCLDCFIEKANDQGIFIPKEAIKIEIFQPEKRDLEFLRIKINEDEKEVNKWDDIQQSYIEKATEIDNERRKEEIKAEIKYRDFVIY